MRIELTRVGLLVYLANHYTTRGAQSNLRRSLLRFSTRPSEWGTQWDDMRRERHILSMLTAFTSSALNPTNVRRSERTNSSGLAQRWISTLSFGGRNSTHYFFSNVSPRFQCMTSFTPPGLISYLGFYFDICEWRIHPACAWTPALMFAPN